jgi:Xaa-Pro dipeptidase
MRPERQVRPTADQREKMNQSPVRSAGEGDGVDHERLRSERLDRFQESMRAHGVAACLLFHPANIRYTTGASMMDVFCAGTTARYCVVPASGEPVLFEWEMAVPYSSRIVRDVRRAGWWQFTGGRRERLADEAVAGVLDVLREFGAADEPVAVDRVDALALLALQRAGIRVLDASPVSDAAREIKTPEEVKLLRINGAIGDAMMADFASAIRPGMREYELFAVLSDALLRRRGEVVFTRLLSSGQNTNPWGSEAHDTLVEEGDLVAVDTDAVGFEGYLIDFSRTFLCGEGRPTREQVEVYRVAHDCLLAMREAIRPGLSYDEFARIASPTVPEKYRHQRYDLMAHGAGLEDEGPIIYYADQAENPADEYLSENMALCLECYVGAVGGSFGVKLEDQVLVTAQGAELLSAFPFDERLLGN